MTFQPPGVIVAREEFSEASCAPINEGLRSFNRNVLGPMPQQPLVVSARDTEGNVIGGVIGEVFLDWLHIQVLWVAEPNRLRGVGSSLVRAIEAEARSVGATRAYVDTVTFQAPGFYAKLGYVEFGRNKNFVKGHDRIYLERYLTARPRADVL